MTKTYGLQSLKCLPSGPSQKMLTNHRSKVVFPRLSCAYDLPGTLAELQILSQEVWVGPEGLHFRRASGQCQTWAFGSHLDLQGPGYVRRGKRDVL